MANYVFICESCKTKLFLQNKITEPAPDVTDIVCEACSTRGKWERVWDIGGVVWRAMGFARNDSLDKQRERGEFLVDN